MHSMLGLIFTRIRPTLFSLFLNKMKHCLESSIEKNTPRKSSTRIKCIINIHWFLLAKRSSQFTQHNFATKLTSSSIFKAPAAARSRSNFFVRQLFYRTKAAIRFEAAFPSQFPFLFPSPFVPPERSFPRYPSDGL